MSRSNKEIAGGLCPLIDTGPPSGEVWVVRKKAVLPFHIVEMGSGPEGLIRLKAAQRDLDLKNQRDTERKLEIGLDARARSMKAFQTGTGDLLDSIKAEKDPADIDIYNTKETWDRQKEIFPDAPKWGKAKTLWESFKRACKETWDKAQPR